MRAAHGDLGVVTLRIDEAPDAGRDRHRDGRHRDGGCSLQHRRSAAATGIHSMKSSASWTCRRISMAPARVLRARLQELEEQKQHDAISSERRSMVGSGDRSEKIRTYNFKENRVTDHRIGLTIHQLEQVMDGKLQPLIEALVSHYQSEKLKAEATTAV